MTSKQTEMPLIRRGPKRKHRIDLLKVGESQVFKASYVGIYGCIRQFCRAGNGHESWRFRIQQQSPKRSMVWRVK